MVTVGSTKGLTLSCLVFSCSCFIYVCVFLVFFPSSSSLGLLSPYLHTSKTTPDFCPLCPSTSLFSGDSPEQRSAATWQRASSVPSLSGDHQWDLHPCTCAKLAGGLPQSHTRHYGVCVASPIHLHLSWPSVAVFCLSLLCPSVSLLQPRCLDFLTYAMCSLSIPIAVVSRSYSLVLHPETLIDHYLGFFTNCCIQTMWIKDFFSVYK